MVLQLRFMVNSGTSFAIATVLGAHGTALRRPGTVVVIAFVTVVPARRDNSPKPVIIRRPVPLP